MRIALVGSADWNLCSRMWCLLLVRKVTRGRDVKRFLACVRLGLVRMQSVFSLLGRGSRPLSVSLSSTMVRYLASTRTEKGVKDL